MQRALRVPLRNQVNHQLARVANKFRDMLAAQNAHRQQLGGYYDKLSEALTRARKTLGYMYPTRSQPPPEDLLELAKEVDLKILELQQAHTGVLKLPSP